MKNLLLTLLIFVCSQQINYAQNGFPLPGATWVFEFANAYADAISRKWEYLGDSTTTEGVIKKFKVTHKEIDAAWELPNTSNVYTWHRNFLYTNDTIWDMNDTIRPLADFSLQVGDSSFTPYYNQNAINNYLGSCDNHGTELILQKGVVTETGIENIDGINSRFYKLKFLNYYGDTVSTKFSERSVITEQHWHYDPGYICGAIVDSGPWFLNCYWDDSLSGPPCPQIEWFDHLNTKELESRASVEIFPNPAQNKITINCSTKEGTFQLTSLQGKVLRQIKLNSHQNQYFLDVEDLVSGLYLITLKNSEDELILTKKVIKQ